MDVPELKELRITGDVVLPPDAIAFRFIRSPGPGGQNVNKVATAVQLRFDTGVLPPPIRERALKLAGARATRRGAILIEARRYRSQARNREDAVERLLKLLRRAASRPKPRKKTGVSPAAKRKRVEAKRQQGQRKQLRKPPSGE